MSFKNFKNQVITLSDGDSPVNTFVLTYDGEFTVDIPAEVVNILTDRGVLPTAPELVPGEEQPMSGGFTVKPETLGAGGVGDFLFPGLPASWVSTTPNADTLDIIVTDGVDTHTYPDSIIRGGFSEGGEGGASQEIAYTFTCPHNRPTLS